MIEDGELWDLLHDGWIREITCLQDEIRLRISIPWLAELLAKENKEIIVTLHSCSQFEFRDWDSDHAICDIPAIEALELGILGADLDSNPPGILTEKGPILVRFTRLSIALPNGEVVEWPQLLKAAEEYWNDFGNGGT